MAAPDETRRCEAQAYIDEHPDNWWVLRPNGVNEPELRVLPHEVLHMLPCCDGAPTPEPPPSKPPVSLRLVYEMSVRGGPGTTQNVLGKLAQDTVTTFDADARTEADGYVWRKLATGYEGKAAWIAERKADGSKVFLSPLS